MGEAVTASSIATAPVFPVPSATWRCFTVGEKYTATSAGPPFQDGSGGKILTCVNYIDDFLLHYYDLLAHKYYRYGILLARPIIGRHPTVQ
jgi:hypothetical protein